MNGNTSVDEKARVVRTLIERSEIYRGIFSRVALWTGTLSALVAIGIYLNNQTKFTIGRPIRAREFATLWIATLILEAAFWLFFLAREARCSGRPFLSAEFRCAIDQLKPFPIIPVAFTGWFFTTGYLGAQELNLVVVWILFYGLMLLATSLFAPRGIVGLGWAFLLTTLSVPVLSNLIEGYISIDVPNVLMGLTFGGYHLIFSALELAHTFVGHLRQTHFSMRSFRRNALQELLLCARFSPMADDRW